MTVHHRLLWVTLLTMCAGADVPLVCAAELRAEVVDADTGIALPARVYLQSSAGEWLFVTSATNDGSAIAYREEWVPFPNSVEKHTTVSAHPFRAEIPAGIYQVEIHHGKEYLPLQTSLTVTDDPVNVVWSLKRWIDMAERGWYSGETHVHRRLAELPNVMLAEDLNVAFPVTYWTTRSDRVPDLEPSALRSQGPSPFGPREDLGARPIVIDDTHVILPRNTEYEVFSVEDRAHTLGALSILNHQSVFTATVPPVAPLAEQAHREGALLDLEKHSWPWSMMLVPVAKIDLFELSNNSVWRTQFAFNQISSPIPSWMNVEQDSPTTLTEWGWLQSGFQTWYALLNCGFRLSPTAGTASGVHPVPLGYSRVYVHTGEAFDLERWLQGLKAGRSFVTTGPMLLATLSSKLPGHELSLSSAGAPPRLSLEIQAHSQRPLSHIEVIVNGDVVESIEPQMQALASGGLATKVMLDVPVEETSWIAVRAIEPQLDGRRRFAHTAPWYVTLNGVPIAPKRPQVEYFIELMEQQIERNRGVLAPPALQEFVQARDIYRALLERAK